MKQRVWAICEMDGSDRVGIVHVVHLSKEEAYKEWKSLEDNPKCEIPFYVEEMELVSLTKTR